ncbi:MAG: histidinol dehydrogenase [Solirubrobacteraceae bacterium]
MSESYATDLQDYADRELAEEVAGVIDAVRRRGDEAVRDFTRRGHGFVPDEFRLRSDEIRRVLTTVPSPVLDRLRRAREETRAFARAQRESMRDVEIESPPGVVNGIRHVAVGSAAAYLSSPAGSPRSAAELTGLQASVVFARVAGVARVVALVPPGDGQLQTLAIATAALAGADELYLLDGVQAIAALALGTESIQRVDVAIGCGDPPMAEAARRLFGERGIELSSAPSELLVIADDSADPQLIARDLLGAVRCGPQSRAVLVTTSIRIAAQVPAEIERSAEANGARLTWQRQGAIHLVRDAQVACAVADRYALECLQIRSSEPHWYLTHLHNYGAACLHPATATDECDEGGSAVPVRLKSRSARQHEALWIGTFLRATTYCHRRGRASAEGDAAPSAGPGVFADNGVPAVHRPGRGLDLVPMLVAPAGT